MTEPEEKKSPEEVLAELDPMRGEVMDRDLVLGVVRRYLAATLDLLRRGHQRGLSGDVVNERNSVAMDQLLRRLFEAADDDACNKVSKLGSACTMVATGGYGRREMSLYSDLDILFLYPRKINAYLEIVSENILYLLWDAGARVGYSTRTVAECVRVAREDWIARTGMLEARYLAGDASLFRKFDETMMAKVFSEKLGDFIKETCERQERRHEQHGRSVFVLEPNLKLSVGGLRDYHTALWVAKSVFRIAGPRDLLHRGLLTEREYAPYTEGVRLLWRLRNELHLNSRRADDLLTFAMQEQIAPAFGYVDGPEGKGAERLMEQYYRHAKVIALQASWLIERAAEAVRRRGQKKAPEPAQEIDGGFVRIDGKIGVSDPACFDRDPTALMRIFDRAHAEDLRLDAKAQSLIGERLHLINDSFRENPKVNALFLGMLKRPSGAGRVLGEMNDLGVLGQYIPEFGEIVCKVQHDAYHVYTVDVHSLFAVERLSDLARNGQAPPLLRRLYRGLKERHLVKLALVLHDIGKGTGKDHHLLGATKAKRIALRMGLSEEESHRVALLVEMHLVMSHLAFKRNIHEQKLLTDFAKTVADEKNLKLLYLLTYADINAVSPDLWTGWKAELLEELYTETFELLEKGVRWGIEFEERMVRNRDGATEELLGEAGIREIDEFYESMGERLLLSLDSGLIVRCYRAYRRLRDEILLVDIAEEEVRGLTHAIVCTPDLPGLYSKIAGVFAANRINIVTSEIYTSRDGIALDLFLVSDRAGRPVKDDARWAAVRRELTSVIRGDADLDTLLQDRMSKQQYGVPSAPRYTARVEIDNRVSDFYSVIDIFAKDKIGLLYDITRTLVDLRLSLYIAKVATSRDRAADVFYVKDERGEKISDEARLEEIRKGLLAVVEEKGPE